eukprot:CAMPEP_0197291560 /NCGR_PEP_ID=MMETSP0890-20130614/17077_1 /TAXON_ID=44058 ORGANISM="Aureoumbra lagunensis, Strain CCMP1510" /NCGR_SAMPLE_ID=MMETSP0890 /ASSEMBLY_ACC=CAM_ASM_000533 /LENGTH=525 /DNA_ID=CAMNT_0042764731 /DNA_START=105 /DNA_END=1682 /DNA_ORIENTATION=+
MLLLRRTFSDKIVPSALIVIEGDLARAKDADDAGIFLMKEKKYEELRARVMNLGEEASLELRINTGLSYLRQGDTQVSDVIFSKMARWCDDHAQDNSILTACLAVHKNWCWALKAGWNAAAFEVMHRTKTWAIRRTTAALDGTLPPNGDDLALSIYDVGLEREVCHHPSLSPGLPHCPENNWKRQAIKTSSKDLYLDLMRRTLTNYVHSDFEDEWKSMLQAAGLPESAQECGIGSAAFPFRKPCEQPWNIAWRAAGVEGLASGIDGEEEERARRRYHTTLSAGDLLHLQLLVESLFAQGVQGHLIETGVFRGGACIFLRALLAALLPNESERIVFVADSFQGIPPPRHINIQQNNQNSFVEPTADWQDRFSFDEDSVRYNFRRYGLLDERVVFVPGFFNVSLPQLVTTKPKFALLRIDADAYDGVLDALNYIYPYLSPGGAVVIDDYHLSGAQAAVHFFRKQHNITAPLLPLPSDYLDTCTSSLQGLNKCKGGGKLAETRRLFVDNKHLVIGIGQHGAYWLKDYI